MTLGAALSQAQVAIAAGSDSARLDAELLLMHVLGCARAQLYARRDEALPAAAATRFAALIERRRAGEPLAYLTGAQGFWTLTLQVTSAVLVPRPETELLVEWALERLPATTTAEVVDLGAGSGAIALALAAERPMARVTATDISAEALQVARDNARQARLMVDFRHGHWWQACAGAHFDLAVANPPYIAGGDPHLPALRHEPLLALCDGADGLQALTEIIGAAPTHLHQGGWLMVEHGHEQGAAVRALFTAAGFADVMTRRDLEQRERATGGRRP